ncbi:MAG: hypothetical protein EOM91_22315 [Sphingobacteriia bacterium]|jgi:small-conductance mechanosensitive channel|nr:hypothetical protein [Sphingobacteriia bacterium]
MGAAKTTEAPSLRDLSQEIQKASIKARAELDDVRRRLASLRGEREGVLSQPLHRDDIAPQLEEHLRRKAAEAAEYLRASITEMRDKSAGYATLSPDSVANYAPLDKAWLPEIIAVLVDPADAAKRLLDAAGELPGVVEGLPLEQRREAVRALDQKIAAAVETETALAESLRAAGIQVPVEGAPDPDPIPGERRMVEGKLQEWTSFTGGRNYGWWPVDRIEQAA